MNVITSIRYQKFEHGQVGHRESNTILKKQLNLNVLLGTGEGLRIAFNSLATSFEESIYTHLYLAGNGIVRHCA